MKVVSFGKATIKAALKASVQIVEQLGRSIR
jgi:hypothetical protein